MGEAALTVEFAGLAGAGKSTLSRRVAELLCGMGIPVSQPSYLLAHGLPHIERIARKSVHVIREMGLSPRYTCLSVGAVASSGQRMRRDYAKMIFNWLLVSSLLRQRGRDGGIELYDQGIFQALWSIGFGGEDGAVEMMLDRLGDRVPLPMVVAIVETSLPTIERRLVVRPEVDSRIESRSPDDGAALERSVLVFERVKQVLADVSRRHPVMRMIVLDNDSDDCLETNATRLAADLERILKEGGRGSRPASRGPEGRFQKVGLETDSPEAAPPVDRSFR